MLVMLLVVRRLPPLPPLACEFFLAWDRLVFRLAPMFTYLHNRSITRQFYRFIIPNPGNITPDDPGETSLACVLSKNRTFEVNVQEKLSPTSINTARLRGCKQVNIVARSLRCRSPEPLAPFGSGRHKLEVINPDLVLHNFLADL